jgi:hypothetical protein
MRAGSGEVEANVWSNLDRLKPIDEVKVVVCDRLRVGSHAVTRLVKALSSPISLVAGPVTTTLLRKVERSAVMIDRADRGPATSRGGRPQIAISSPGSSVSARIARSLN